MGNKRSRARVRRYAKIRPGNPVIGVRGSGEKLADAQRRRNLYMHSSEGLRRRVLRELGHATYVDYVEDELPQDPKKAKKLVEIATKPKKPNDPMPATDLTHPVQYLHPTPDLCVYSLEVHLG